MVGILIRFLNFFCLCSHSLLWLFLIPLQSEVEESLKRIQGHKGVVGIVIVNQEGRETQLVLIYFDRVSKKYAKYFLA